MKTGKNKGQLGAMGIITLAVAVMIGAYLVGSIYDSIDQTDLPAAVTEAMEDSLDNSSTGLTLMAVGIIVAAAIFILALMGGRR